MDAILQQKKAVSKRKLWLSRFLVLLLGVTTGLFCGIYFKTAFATRDSGLGGLTEAMIRDDETKIVRENKDKPIMSLNPINAFIVAEYKTSQMQYVTMNATGSINAMNVKQNLYTKKYKIEDKYFVENISKGSVILGIDTNIAERNYYDESTDIVQIYKGKIVDETSANFGDMTKQMSYDEWYDLNGTTPKDFHPYIISTKTVDKSTPIEQVTLDNGAVGYKTTFALKNTSALLYVSQIKNLSGLKDDPIVDYINLEVYINGDGTLYRIVVDEKYEVKKGIYVGTKSDMIYNFEYTKAEIPTA